MKYKKLESNDQKVLKQAKTKRDGVIKPSKLQFQSIFKHGKIFDALQNATNQN